MTSIEAIDSHTGGEPTRTVISGFPDLGEGTLKQRRDRFAREHDALRRAIACEPRGSDVVVGALLVPPDDARAVTGVIFFNNVGPLWMCGHGAIGVIRSLQFLGRIEPGQHWLDTPAGLVGARLHEDGRVSIDNVPSYRHARDVSVTLMDERVVQGDVAWGGNWFFITPETPIPLEPNHWRDLTAYAEDIRRALEEAGIRGADGLEIDHIEINTASPTPGMDARNFVLCPGLAYDRSPCGTGTSAKLACLAADGTLAAGAVWRQESLIGSVFEGTWRPGEDGSVLPTITGSAFVTAQSRLVLDPTDPFVCGFSG
ncbi:proline racemase family protein [Xanthomonadaceae bacterium XH05]|nr:proline racemase family protein [Xanthomonadaceae bacterium XH05]